MVTHWPLSPSHQVSVSAYINLINNRKQNRSQAPPSSHTKIDQQSFGKKIMDHQQQIQAPSSDTKIERRLIEKNRRNQMKILYSKLNSLLPNFNPKQMIPLPDQIDEAINYIKSLEAKVKMAQEKKERLMEKKRSHAACCSSSSFETKKKSLNSSPQIQIHEMGSSLEIVLINCLDNQFIFYEIIRILHEENVEVVSANSSLSGDSMLNVVHAQIQQSLYQLGTPKVSERLKRLVYGSTSSDVEIQPAELLDYLETGTDTWEFQLS